MYTDQSAECFGVEIQAAPNLRDGFDANHVTNTKHDRCGRQRFQTRTQPGALRPGSLVLYC